MHVPEPLRNSPFQMYRRTSLYSGQYGHSSPRPTVNKIGGHGTPSRPVPSPESKTYMQGLPDGYAPHPGSMPTPSNDYQPYDNSAALGMFRANGPGLSGEFQMGGLNSGRAGALGPQVKYEDSIMDEDFFEQQMQLLREQFGESSLPQWEGNPLARQLMETEATEEIPEFDNDLRAQMLEIRMAVEQMRAEPHSEPRDFFEQQEQAMDAQYDELQHELLGYDAQMEEMFNAQEALFDVPQGETLSLEQLVESSEMLGEGPSDIAEMADYDDGLTTPEPLEQEMGEGAEQTESMEPDPDQLQYYDGVMAPEMDNDRMQEMMDPLMMPGFYGPMPFGPGPMPGPGPGGP